MTLDAESICDQIVTSSINGLYQGVILTALLALARWRCARSLITTIS